MHFGFKVLEKLWAQENDISNLETLKLIAKWLNINIFIIYERIEYGKGVEIEKRACNKDLNLTSLFYRGDTKKNNILKRPLIMLYRKKNKNNNLSAFSAVAVAVATSSSVKLKISPVGE